MDALIVLTITLLLFAGAVYLMLNRRANAQAARQAVMNVRQASAKRLGDLLAEAAHAHLNGVSTVPAPVTEPRRATAPLSSAGIAALGTAAPSAPIVAIPPSLSDDAISPEALDDLSSFSDETQPHTETEDDAHMPARKKSTSKTKADVAAPPTLHTHDLRFNIRFPNDNVAQAVRVRSETEPQSVLKLLGIKDSKPTIFVTGGASYMSQEDAERTREMIESVAAFAQEHGAVIVDGGTESGVMQMVGEARRKGAYNFPLIGVSPFGKVQYPNHVNPSAEAELEDSHSHFVLVDGEEWGAESEMIIGVTKALSGLGARPAVGILINGGKIARQEVYLAVSKEIPMVILEGSGRLADEIATAFKTGKASQRILQAILGGGDIQLISTEEGTGALREKLEKRFAR